MSNTRYALAAAVLGLVALAPVPALAYVGPGAGLSAIGTFLALVAAVFLAIVGFIWYPIKRLFGRKSSHASARRRVDASESDSGNRPGRQ